MASTLIAGVSSLLIMTNFLAKMCGYSEIGWNFELLFMIVDGAALTSMVGVELLEFFSYLDLRAIH